MSQFLKEKLLKDLEELKRSGLYKNERIIKNPQGAEIEGSKLTTEHPRWSKKTGTKQQFSVNL